MTVTDAIGGVHPCGARDARIVSLVPSITELLFDLGLGDRVVGRTTFCVHPAAAVASVARVGGTKKVRLDRLRALAPTHVIVNVDENDREQVEAIRRFVPHVVVTHPLGPRDNLALYRLIGDLFGVEPAAQRLADALEHELEALRATERPVRSVLYLIWRNPWMTVARDTYISRTLALVNWNTHPSASHDRYPVVALGPTLLEHVDLVLLSSEPFPFNRQHFEEVHGALGSGSVAVEAIDGEMTSWYGSRAVPAMSYLGRLADRLATRTAA